MRLKSAIGFFGSILVMSALLVWGSVSPHAQTQTCPTGTGSDNFCPTVENEQYLVSGTIESPPFVYTSGFYAAEDGGGGVLYALQSSCTGLTPNGGSIVEQGTVGVENVVHAFQGGSDGEYPEAGLLKVNGKLYGTTNGGGGRMTGVRSS